MDNLEKKEKTAEDVLIADKDLASVSGGDLEGEVIIEFLDTPCPKCKQKSLVRSQRFLICRNKDCDFLRTH